MPSHTHYTTSFPSPRVDSGQDNNRLVYLWDEQMKLLKGQTDGQEGVEGWMVVWLHLKLRFYQQGFGFVWVFLLLTFGAKIKHN